MFGRRQQGVRNSREVHRETFWTEQRVVEQTAPEYLPFAQNVLSRPLIYKNSNVK
jgi:hypothetical protein